MVTHSYTKSVNYKDYSFDKSGYQSLLTDHHVQELWPLVYLIFNQSKKLMYVGETTNAANRVKAHLSNPVRKGLQTLMLITSDKFNKSATLDIESYLIQYISGEGHFKLQNANAGLMFHRYYEREQFKMVFQGIWSQLIHSKIARKALRDIDNSDIFKYSPYKSLAKEQLDVAYDLIDGLYQGKKIFIVNGGAGSGKSVLATYLIKLVTTSVSELPEEDGIADTNFLGLVKRLVSKYPRLKLAFVIPMPSFRKTIQKVFAKVNGLNSRMVISPAALKDQQYDLVFVDEAHRLRRRVNLANYGGHDAVNKALGLPPTATELDWVLQQSKRCVFFYDQGQRVKPTDVVPRDFQALKSKAGTQFFQLNSQLRARGGADYVRFLEQLLAGKKTRGSKFKHPDYELVLFDDITDLLGQMKLREEEFGLCRLVAGYSWEWKSKKDKKKKDILIGSHKLVWNSTNIDWINSPNAVNEVGCIHTTQGYDLNYVGIIFGKEISYDPITKEIIIYREHYCDKNGKNGVRTDEELKGYIVNIYRTMMLRGIRGTYLYIEDNSLFEYLKRYISLK